MDMTKECKTTETKVQCKNCPHWHGRSQEWGDCYRIIGQLEPDLFTCKNDFGYPFTIPFDPHDAKYFKYSMDFDKLYKPKHMPLNSGFIEVHEVKEKDILYSENGSERLGVHKLYYFKTHKDYNECGLEEEYA